MFDYICMFSVCVHVCIYIYVYIYIYVHIYAYIYFDIYIYILRTTYLFLASLAQSQCLHTTEELTRQKTLIHFLTAADCAIHVRQTGDMQRRERKKERKKDQEIPGGEREGG